MTITQGIHLEKMGMKNYIAAILFAGAAFLALGDLASAHAKLDHCAPAPGTAVATPPTEVRCWFTEEIDSKQSTLEIADVNGARVDNNDGHVDLNDPDHKQMFATVKPLATGVYKVTWHTVTPDDNGISDGVFYFGVGQVAVPTYAPTPVSEATGSPAASTPAPAAGATATTAPTAAATVVPASTPAPVVPETASNSSIPVVVVVGLLQAAIIIGVLVFLFRSTPS
jgi:methionine-rich copper-binding protein CopC